MTQLTQKQLNISKSISYFLRHKPQELNIALDTDGWTELDSFINKLSTHLKSTVTVEDIELILKLSEKKRFKINRSQNLIKARYGHSVDIKPNYPLVKENITLYHGTAKTNIESIKNQGILSKNRQFVHLTSEYHLAELTAKRWSNNIIVLEINTDQLRKDGINIYDIGEDIYLIEAVEPKYITNFS
jgi:putative RNA 2'-phosphotransferase